MPKSHWLVEGLIPASDTGACIELVGTEGCGKSFLTLDLACCISLGKPWLGHATSTSGYVLYLCGERMAEMPKRIEAWAARHNGGVLPTTTAFVTAPICLANTRDMDELIDTVDARFPQPPLLVIIDTLTSFQSGVDENSAKDASMVRDAIKRIQAKYKSSVVVVHHLNKSGSSSRGSNVLRGHVDAEYWLTKAGLTLTLDAKKMSKGEELKVGIKLTQVETSLEPTLVVDRWENQTKAATKVKVLFADKLSEPSWSDKIKQVKGTGEWTVAEAVQITGLSRATLQRATDTPAVERVRHGFYRLV